MSIHVDISEEAKAELEKQQRKSKLSSIGISVLVIAVIFLTLGLIFLPPISKDADTVVIYKGEVVTDDTLDPAPDPTRIQKKPTAPSSSQVKTIASSAPSAVSIPTPDIAIETEAVDFGDGQSFGGGWGNNVGIGAGGGATFFQQEVKAERVAFVIDYSLSMQNLSRDPLMREELTRSLKSLPSGTKYQLIFFAEHPWVAGDKVVMRNRRYMKTVEDKAGKVHDIRAKNYIKRDVPWLDVNSSNTRESVSLVEGTDLYWGTAWTNPLKVAMNMDPAPQVIFFMTDGIGADGESAVIKSAKEAKRKGVVINTVALMEPEAEEMMAKLAFGTGGQFTLVRKDGSSEVISK